MILCKPFRLNNGKIGPGIGPITFFFDLLGFLGHNTPWNDVPIGVCTITVGNAVGI
jgi:hypothetical protein